MLATRPVFFGFGVWLLVHGALASTGCSSRTTDAQDSPAVEIPPQAVNRAAPLRSGQQEARALFASFCATCHGTSGRGDGPAAQGLSVRPRDYTDRAWQASMTDAAIAKIIVEGGAAVGKSPLMPASPQLGVKPEVVRELIEHIRGFGAQAP